MLCGLLQFRINSETMKLVLKGCTPWIGDQSVGSSLPTQHNTNIEELLADIHATIGI
jgi:hypothetical protein